MSGLAIVAGEWENLKKDTAFLGWGWGWGCEPIWGVGEDRGYCADEGEGKRKCGSYAFSFRPSAVPLAALAETGGEWGSGESRRRKPVPIVNVLGAGRADHRQNCAKGQRALHYALLSTLDSGSHEQVWKGGDSRGEVDLRWCE